MCPVSVLQEFAAFACSERSRLGLPVSLVIQASGSQFVLRLTEHPHSTLSKLPVKLTSKGLGEVSFSLWYLDSIAYPILYTLVIIDQNFFSQF